MAPSLSRSKWTAASNAFSALPLHAQLAFAAAVATTVAITYFRCLNMEAAAAFKGYFPSILALQLWSRPDFTADFPGGEQELSKSLPLHLYPIADALGIPSGIVFVLAIALEVIALFAGAYVATRRLVPEADITAALLAGMCLATSSMANCNLAQWGHPFYGSVYNYAYGMGLAGVALVLTRRETLGAAWLALCAATHPVLGLMFAGFAFIALLADFRALDFRRLLAPAAVWLTIAGAWFSASLGFSDVSGAAIPGDLFAGLTRMMGFHWYPVHLGLLSTRHQTALLPFLAFCLLLVLYLYGTKDTLIGLRFQLAVGFAALLALTVAGVLISLYLTSPLLLKLALHRASSLILILGTVIVVPGLWKDVIDGDHLRAPLALAILALVFITPHGVPVAWALALAAASLASVVRGNAPLNQRSIALGTCMLAITGVLAWLWASGTMLSWTSPAYTAFHLVLSRPTATMALVAIAVIATMRAHKPAVAMAVIALTALTTTPRQRQFSSQLELSQATDYLAAQRWAKQNTEPGSVFMPDPGHAYGWRQFSERPSFGSVREWLYGAFVYDSKLSRLDEGLRRFALLGLDYKSYLAMEDAQPRSGYEAVMKDVRSSYYAKDAGWFSAIAKGNAIAYFVFDKKYLSGQRPVSTVYENDRYFIGKAF